MVGHQWLHKGCVVTSTARVSRGIQHARRIFSAHALRAGLSTLAVCSLHTRFARDSARSPYVLSARAWHGIQQFGWGGRSTGEEGERASLSLNFYHVGEKTDFVCFTYGEWNF